MNTESIARRSLFILLLGAIALLTAVAAPLGVALFSATVLAAVLWPLCTRLTRWFRGRRKVAAGVLVFSSVVVLVGPLLWMSAFVVTEVTQGVDYVADTVRSEGVLGLIEKLPEPAAEAARYLVKQLPSKSGKTADQVAQQISAQTGKAAVVMGAALSATGAFLFQTIMMLIALFFFLLHGEEAVAWIDDVSPLRKGQTRELLSEFKKVAYAVIMSTLITAGIQAFAALIGYWIARVPHPVFFGATTFIIAFIPAVGAGGVALSAALLLLVTGHEYPALFLAIWAVTVVGLVDNLVKPLLIRGGVEMHGAIVFFSLIGGLSAFGAVGLLLGPLTVALFLTVLRMYQRDYLQHPVSITPTSPGSG